MSSESEPLPVVVSKIDKSKCLEVSYKKIELDKAMSLLQFLLLLFQGMMKDLMQSVSNISDQMEASR